MRFLPMPNVKMTSDMEYKDFVKETGKCLECGTEITYGRTDKKFCSDVCKNKYHNRRHGEYIRTHAKVINALDKNHEILKQMLQTGITSAKIGDMVQWGFNPEYVTNARKIRHKMEYRCFDIRYFQSENKIYKIEAVKPIDH